MNKVSIQGQWVIDTLSSASVTWMCFLAGVRCPWTLSAGFWRGSSLGRRVLTHRGRQLTDWASCSSCVTTTSSRQEARWSKNLRTLGKDLNLLYMALLCPVLYRWDFFFLSFFLSLFIQVCVFVIYVRLG